MLPEIPCVHDQVVSLWGPSDADRLAPEPCRTRADVATGVIMDSCPAPPRGNGGAGAAAQVTGRSKPEWPQIAQACMFGKRMVEFTVFGRARPQAQNRTMPVMRTLPDGRKVPVLRTLPNGTQVPITVHPNPRDTVNWRSDVKSAALAAWDGSHGLFQGPLQMDVTIYVERPKGMVWKKRPMPELACTAGPDRSNVMKSLEDALQGVLYRNDNQLADGRVRKAYCPGLGYGDERPRTVVRLEEIEA